MIKSILVASAIWVAVAFIAGALPARAGPWSQDHLFPVLSASGRMRMVHRNANDCAPSSAVAVWGKGLSDGPPLGYRCVDYMNGG